MFKTPATSLKVNQFIISTQKYVQIFRKNVRVVISHVKMVGDVQLMVHRFLVFAQMAGLVEHANFRFGLAAQITTVLGTKNIVKAVELTRDVLNV